MASAPIIDQQAAIASLEALERWRLSGVTENGADYRCEIHSPWSYGLGFNWEVTLWSQSTQRREVAVGRTLWSAINSALKAWEE